MTLVQQFVILISVIFLSLNAFTNPNSVSSDKVSCVCEDANALTCSEVIIDIQYNKNGKMDFLKMNKKAAEHCKAILDCQPRNQENIKYIAADCV